MTDQPASQWPVYDGQSDPAGLARYVVPDAVAALVAGVPHASGESAVRRLEAVWAGLRAIRIGYTYAAPGSGSSGQVVRAPAEVLVAPRSGTCLDVALVLAGACVNAGLSTVVIVLDSTVEGRAGHALVAVSLTGGWPGGAPLGPQRWTNLPEGLLEQVRDDFGMPGRDLVVLDPIGVTIGLDSSPTVGLDADLGEAARAGQAYLTDPGWAWRIAVLARARPDAYRPAGGPLVLPLRGPFADPAEAGTPLQALRAEYRLTRFQARDEYTVLVDLAEQAFTGDRTSVLVVHGAGGAGKTRLALEVADRLRQRGWYTGILKENLAGTDPASLPWLTQVRAPLLVVLDYADARVADAQALLTVLQARTGPPAVLLVTARSLDGDWLESMTGSQTSHAHPLAIPDPIGLPDVHPHPRGVFAATYRALRNPDPHERYQPAIQVPPLPPPAPGVTWTTLDLVLLAWLAATRDTPSTRPPPSGAGTGVAGLPRTQRALYGEVMDHEVRYWARAYTDRTGEPRPNLDLLRQAGAVLTLRQPDPAAADQVLQALPPLAQDGQRRDTIKLTMTDCLSPGTAQPLAIRPDPVGDHHLLTTLAAHPDLLTAALAGTGSDELAPALVVLTRAGTENPHPATHLIEALIRDEPARWPTVLAVAAAMGGAARAALENLVTAPACALPLSELSASIPFHAVGPSRLGLLTDEVRLAAVPPTDPANRAGLLLRVSERRRLTGDRDGALSAIDEAVTLRRALAEANPGAFTPNLAGSLNNQANLRSETGDRAGALSAIDEAVTLRRALAEANPGAFTPDLAGSLNNQANRRSETGDRAGALSAIDEAVTLRRALAEANPAAFTPDLAASLNNQANRRSETGDRAGALSAIDEAVTLYRALAEANPGAFTPDLAASLNNQANRRSETGDRAGALSAIDEAVTLYRALAEANPGAFTPDLAASLNNQANRRSETGDRAGALSAIDEAVTLYRALAEANPGAFTPDLAMSLNNQANLRSETGDRAGALSAIDEAVTLRRALAEANPGAFTPDLAGSLNNQSAFRSETGDRAGALSAIDEAVTLYRALAEANPGAFTPDLAMSLNNQANLRSETGDRAGALSAIDEAVTLYRALAEANPGAFTPNLAASLNNQANLRSETGDRAGALSAIDEAVTLYRALAEANPGAFTPNLAASLNNQANLRSETGDRAGALSAIDEAVTLYRALAEANPGAFTPNLAGSLNNQANRRSETGDRAGALSAIDEAVTLRRALAQANPAAFTPDLAGSLNNQANLRSETGDRAGALSAIDEAVTLRRALAEANPGAFTPDLAGSLNNQSAFRSETGDRAGALSAIDEAVTLYRALAEANPGAFTPDLAGSLNNQSNRRSETGDRAGALSAIDEAVTLRRALAQANPGAFTPNLAASLNNQANRRSETGDRAGALSAIDEAVTLRRALAQANPAAFTPDLIRSTRIWATLLSEAGDLPAASTAWTESRLVVGLPFVATVTAAAATWLHSHNDPKAAAALLGQAVREAEASAPPDQPQVSAHALTDIRRQVRGTAMALPDLHDGLQLPGWATEPIDDTVLDLLNAWAAARDLGERAAVLTRHADTLRSPTLDSTLDVVGFLNPGDAGVREVRAIATETTRHGLDAVVDELTRTHNAWQLVAAWVTSDTWPATIAFLQAHAHELGEPAVQHVLTQSQDPAVAQHAALYRLATRHDDEHLLALLTDAHAASDTALTHLEHGHHHAMIDVYLANPRILNVPGSGPFTAAVLTALHGQRDDAERLAADTRHNAAPVQRQALAIRLRDGLSRADLTPEQRATLEAVHHILSPKDPDPPLH